MSKKQESLRLDIEAGDALLACRDAIQTLGWKEAEVQAHCVVAKVGFGLFSNPSRIEMRVEPVGDATDVHLNGSIKQVGPVANSTLTKQMEAAKGGIQAGALRFRNVAPANKGETAEVGVEARLKRLESLRDAGTITNEEYESQRKRVLADL